MGRWGIFPEDSDEAADWFADLHDQTGLAKIVEDTLSLPDLVANHEQIRAAAYLVSVLARTYMWPVNDIDRHIQLAQTRLQEMLVSEQWLQLYKDNSEVLERVQFEIDFLQELLLPEEEEQ